MSKNLSHEDILRVIAESGLAPVAVSGNCFTLAVALRRTLLPRGVLAVAVNAQLLKAQNRYVGHAAVRYDGAFYHGEGWMDWEEFLDWGNLDPHDQEYAERAGMTLKAWSCVARKSEIYELDEEELMGGYVKLDLLPTFEAAIRDARKRLGF